METVLAQQKSPDAPKDIGLQKLESHSASVVQTASNGSLPDAALAEVGAISDVITGNAIIEANPTLRITSRRDIPVNGEIYSDCLMKSCFFNSSSDR